MKIIDVWIDIFVMMNSDLPGVTVKNIPTREIIPPV